VCLAANGLNQYASVGGTSFSHDARGNLTSYDLENHLTAVSGAAAMSLAYDPQGRLSQTVANAVTTQFFYDGDALVAEYDAAGALLRRYVHGPGVDEPIVWYEGAGLGTRRWLHADHQGSIIATSDAAAAPTTHAYSPYGEPADDNWTGSRFRYTGQIALNDAPGLRLYHYKARVYDPALGRFLQTDPVG
jgi:RHS repeat-associated protein